MERGDHPEVSLVPSPIPAGKLKHDCDYMTLVFLQPWSLDSHRMNRQIQLYIYPFLDLLLAAGARDA